jgi:hypothetical protein
MLSSLVILSAISYFLNGHFLPTDPKMAILFQNALLLIVLGSSFLEYYYTKPADSVINSLMSIISLLGVYSLAPRIPWILMSLYCVFVFVVSSICVAVSSSSNISGWRKKVAKLTYKPSVVFGKARVIFTIVFLASLYFFYSIQDRITITLVIFWGIFISLWPLHIPHLLSQISFSRKLQLQMTGEILRIDNPNIIRIALTGDYIWDHGKPELAILPDGEARWVQPLFSQFQDGRLLATGILTNIREELSTNLRNCIIEKSSLSTSPTIEEMNHSLGGGEKSTLVGYVIEHSTVNGIRFETLSHTSCYDGMLVWTKIKGATVYYQIVHGETFEETFSMDKHGFQVATAVQLGVLQSDTGFEKYDWLPSMNTPVFIEGISSTSKVNSIQENDFILGNIPKSRIQVGGNFSKGFHQHTAILGVTGSGKTELAFDLIRHSLHEKLKVVCIDLTAQYLGRLSDLEPIDLSISEETANELATKLFEVETGQYNAGTEKRALKSFDDRLRQDIEESIKNFMSDSEKSGLGIIRLEEISNTKATLWITELYMTCLLRYARDHIGDHPKTLIVVEEAHTVMPEANTMGLGDYDSKGLVGKIAQIALQGRKYGVGLLVLAQRTATVSKTVLTQCNTIISFRCYDDTSLNFLRNIYGSDYVNLIPNLPKLNAIAFGPWIRSQQPIVFEVPFEDSKSSEA